MKLVWRFELTKVTIHYTDLFFYGSQIFFLSNHQKNTIFKAYTESNETKPTFSII